MTLAEILNIESTEWVAAGADALADIAEEEDVLLIVGDNPRVWDELLTLGECLRDALAWEDLYV